jgi:hypothetical protein
MSVEPWRRLTRGERDAIAAEAESLPLSDVAKMRVRFTP